MMPPGASLNWGSMEWRLLFLRHARAQAKSERLGDESRDPGLAGEGHVQAERTADWLRNDVGQAIHVFCSPMRRCLLTANPLAVCADAGGVLCSATCHAALCEHNNDPADFDAAAIACEFPELLGGTALHKVAFHGFGDGPGAYGDTAVRAAAMAGWLANEVRTMTLSGIGGTGSVSSSAIVIVSHQTFLDCLLQVIVMGDASIWEYGAPKFKLANAGITELRVGPVGADLVPIARVSRYNVTEHLAAEPSDKSLAAEPPDKSQATSASKPTAAWLDANGTTVVDGDAAGEQQRRRMQQCCTST
eukprot:NODE_8384_length_1499_cov_5.917638.p1 GENE.NODE_8384_length_1499_cov_5.917638~~NODE_8384_length_1499_cov_5.917638.p1  ORF type:complete len:326 (+),score=65.86 NODE_8384_length_1499_cov_5.917638:67-978(+)